MNKEEKIKREQAVVAQMILLYCKKNHKSQKHPCSECSDLITYAQGRSARCPFMENKTFCSNCTVHCYSPQMREKIRTVMRFSGPRMIFYHPIMALWHLISSIKEKKQLKK